MVKNLLLLDPIPSKLWALAAPQRRGLLEEISRLLLGPGSNPAAAGRIRTHRIEDPRSSGLSVAYTQVADRLVILELARHLKESHRNQLEEDAEALKHMDLRGLGLFIDARPGQPNFASYLERAVSIYCRSSRHPEHGAEHGSPGDEQIKLDLFNRLTTSPNTPWPSSEARQKLKEVLDRAEHDPQVIERGSQRFLVVEQSRLPALMCRRNAAEMYRELFREAEPIERFERPQGRAPGRLLDLTHSEKR